MDRSDRYLYAARMLGFLERYADELEMLAEGESIFPNDARFPRFRGHRLISMRQFEEAERVLALAWSIAERYPDEHEFYKEEIVADLVKVVLDNTASLRHSRWLVDQDSVSQTVGMYKSTLHCSIWYHLGVARYLLWDFDGAAECFRQVADRAVDRGISLSSRDWRYMSLRRAGKPEEAALVLSEIDLAAAEFPAAAADYLRRFRLYRGEIGPDEFIAGMPDGQVGLSTEGYGIASWYLWRGELDVGRKLLLRVLQNGSRNAFGYIAAEVDLEKI